MALGAGTGVTLLTGCLAPLESIEPNGTSPGTGNFRLLISDLPADIGDFDSLEVSFDAARIFPDDIDDENERGDGNRNGQPGNADNESTDNAPDNAHPSEDDEESDDNGDATNYDGGEAGNGFYVLDLDDATVDLTEVIGDKAIAVYERELPEGEYNKLELYVSETDGIVDGEDVEVTVPSGKLQITHSFELQEGQEVDFVFDIHVVRRGQQDHYNLRPVISGSGINGEDVDVEEVDGTPGDAGEHDKPDDAGPNDNDADQAQDIGNESPDNAPEDAGPPDE